MNSTILSDSKFTQAVEDRYISKLKEHMGIKSIFEALIYVNKSLKPIYYMEGMVRNGNTFIYYNDMDIEIPKHEKNRVISAYTGDGVKEQNATNIFYTKKCHE